MVLYFTGTGNSRWVAEQIAELTNDKAFNMSTLSPSDVSLSPGEKLGIVFPIYAWSAPAPVKDFLSKACIPDDTYCFAVCTCGKDCGKAIEYLEKAIDHKIDCAISLVMPNNYIQGGSCDTEKEAIKTISAAKPKLHDFAKKVNESVVYRKLTRGPFPSILTGVISPSFTKYATSDEPFTVSDTCTSCGTCAKACPMNNITMVDGKPSWNGNCCQCTACINHCPVEAIQYGRGTKGRTRYFFKEEYAK